MKKQFLVWTGKPVEVDTIAGFEYPLIPFSNGKIRRLYTLYQHTDEQAPPSLPYAPVHLKGAFIEDQGHDYSQDEKGNIHYFTRVTNEAVWLLVEVE